MSEIKTTQKMTSRKTVRLKTLGYPKKSLINSPTEHPNNPNSLNRDPLRLTSKPPQRSYLRPPRSQPEPPLQPPPNPPSKSQSKPRRQQYNVPPPSLTSSASNGNFPSLVEEIEREVKECSLSVKSQLSSVDTSFETDSITDSSFETEKVEDVLSKECGLLNLFEEAFDIYMRAGYDEKVAGGFFYLTQRLQQNANCADLCDERHLMRRFFKSLDSYTGTPNCQYSQMFYIMTLMRCLNRFKSKTVKTKALPRHWRIELVVECPWLGAKWSSKSNSGGNFGNRYHLLVILIKLLKAEAENQVLQRMWKTSSICYVFGYDPNTEINRGPKTAFILTLSGSAKIAALIRSCLSLEVNVGHFEWPAKWPDDAFTARLEIISAVVLQHGCPQRTSMEFNPFDDMCSDTTEKKASRHDEGKCGLSRKLSGAEAAKKGNEQKTDLKPSLKVPNTFPKNSAKHKVKFI